MARSSTAPIPFGVPGLFSLALTPLGWLLFLGDVFSLKRTWWDSPYLLVILFAVATALAVWSVRSLFGMVALLLALPSFGAVCLFLLWSGPALP